MGANGEHLLQASLAAEQLPFLVFEFLFIFSTRLRFCDGFLMMNQKFNDDLFYVEDIEKTKRISYLHLFFGDPAQESS